jgi:hypothetical protein
MVEFHGLISEYIRYNTFKKKKNIDQKINPSF